MKAWEKKKAQNKASDAGRKVELAEGLKRGDPEAIRKDAARKETMRKANAKRRGKAYIPKEAKEKENKPPANVLRCRLRYRGEVQGDNPVQSQRFSCYLLHQLLDTIASSITYIY